MGRSWEQFPLADLRDERSCLIFGHHCPVFYAAGNSGVFPDASFWLEAYFFCAFQS
jgi:hypothetical protein